MTVLHCSQKLLKRLRRPASLPAPAPSTNPLGEWYADIDFIDRQPFVLMMNAATGLVLVLPGRAEYLKRLHLCAAEQLASLLQACGIEGPLAEAELDAWQQPATYARTSNRSMVASINQRKMDAWTHFAYHGHSAFEVALRMLETPFTRKDLGRDYHLAPDLVRARLLPSAKILPFRIASTRH
ncbi:MAG TPA: hypothetical protein VMK82_06360 [Steroidobacteraceae bacterium]|nr:hypothetical protein [Steroidobacteraceae bacterium]